MHNVLATYPIDGGRCFVPTKNGSNFHKTPHMKNLLRNSQKMKSFHNFFPWIIVFSKRFVLIPGDPGYFIPELWELPDEEFIRRELLLTVWTDAGAMCVPLIPNDEIKCRYKRYFSNSASCFLHFVLSVLCCPLYVTSAGANVANEYNFWNIWAK